MNLLSEIEKQDKKNTYVLLLRKKYFDTLRVPVNFQKVLIHSRHYSVSEQFEILRVLKKINPDITHFLHFNVPLLYNKPYIVTIHDLLMHDGVGKDATTLPKWKYLIKRKGYRTVFDHAVKNAQHIISPSQYVKNQIIKTYKLNPKKISVIYEGVSLVNNKSRNRTGDYFLYVGNAYPHKNITTLLRAIRLVNSASQQIIRLILVTPRDVFTDRLKKQISELKVSKFVEIKSGVTDDVLKKLYSNAIAFVYPSISEGFGLPGLEAMLCQTRLIASDIEVFHEVYKSQAEYFNPKSAEELYLSLQKIIKENPDTRSKKLAAARLFASDYSWENMARDTLALYEKA